MLRALPFIVFLALCSPAFAQGPGGYRVLDGDTIFDFHRPAHTGSAPPGRE